ncbi:MAG: GTP cyclohydrolase FolE2 [Burkholderiales bacterium]|jgi:GTP cyclohydrolase I|nr:GTP cyclohydrolase FolE2 [Betaproteobacteria bacterium]
MNQRHPHLPFTPQSDALRDGVPDVQGRADVRHIAIDQVGIRGIRHPLRVQSADGSVQHTVGMFSMTVNLRGDVKGTHMSRFVELLEAERAGKAALDPAGLHSLLQRMVAKLEVNEGVISIEFPYFIEKSAPVSGVTSLLDYQVTLTGRMRSGQFSSTTKVVAPVTSLCPCSKEISDYGAHNQRSHITMTIEAAKPITIDEIVRIAEEQASSELYGVLKRVDEKFVTERAYDNPKFVEDLVRDIAAALNRDERIIAYTLEAENFESIHNHTAYALITRHK